MRYYVFYDNSGAIRAQNINHDAYPDMSRIDVGEVPIDILANYVSQGRLTPLPEKPNSTDYFIFDCEHGSWLPNIELMTEWSKFQRQALLSESDWTDTLSAKARLGDALYQTWQDYRQALRDITQQAGFPQEITWPVAPS